MTPLETIEMLAAKVTDLERAQHSLEKELDYARNRRYRAEGAIATFLQALKDLNDHIEPGSVI